MQSANQLIKGAEKKTEQGAGCPLSGGDGGEETMTYQERKPIISLNMAPDVFDSQLGCGINSDKSIFDKTAIF